MSENAKPTIISKSDIPEPELRCTVSFEERRTLRQWERQGTPFTMMLDRVAVRLLNALEAHEAIADEDEREEERNNGPFGVGA